MQATIARMQEAGGDAEWTRYMAEEYRTLNRVTIEELNRCILAAGLRVTKLELLTHTVHIPPALARYPLTDLGIAGVKLLAVHAP